MASDLIIEQADYPAMASLLKHFPDEFPVGQYSACISCSVTHAPLQKDSGYRLEDL